MIKQLVAVSAFGLAASQTAMAVNPDFMITHRLSTFTANSTTTTVTPKGGDEAEVKSETGGMSWNEPSLMEFAMFHDGWAVYAYPFAPDATLWVGKSIGPVEVGPTFSFSNTTTKLTVGEADPVETSGSQLGLGAYVFYGMDLGAVGLETNLNPYFTMRTTKETETNGEGATATTAEVESTTSGINLVWDLLITKKIGENFTWAGGVELAWNSLSVEQEFDGKEVEAEQTSSDLNIGVVLTEFRYGF